MMPISMPQTCRSNLARQTAAVRVDPDLARSRRWQTTGAGVSTTAAVAQRSTRHHLRPIGGVAVTVTKPPTIDAVNVHGFFA